MNWKVMDGELGWAIKQVAAAQFETYN